MWTTAWRGTRASFLILVIGGIPFVLAFVWVRLWFDLAQVRAVAGNDRFTRRNAVRTFRIAIRRAWRGYWAYVAITILAWMVTAVALVIWAKVPARAVWLTFLLLEVIMLAQVFARLWQKACATTWYEMNPEPVPLAPAPYEPFVATLNEDIAGSVSDVDAPPSPEIEAAPEDASHGSAR